MSIKANTDHREIYGEGKSEQIIGDLIKETDEETRKKLYIATKCAYRIRPSLLWQLFYHC